MKSERIPLGTGAFTKVPCGRFNLIIWGWFAPCLVGLSSDQIPELKVKVRGLIQELNSWALEKSAPDETLDCVLIEGIVEGSSAFSKSVTFDLQPGSGHRNSGQRLIDGVPAPELVPDSLRFSSITQMVFAPSVL